GGKSQNTIRQDFMGVIELSEFINERAEALGISKAELARRAKISRAELYNLLSGDVRQARLTTFIALGEALRVHPLTLINSFLGEINISSPCQKIKNS
ncbi:MAG: helix-turn-helix transcriptional regulator, partial [Firmicutes bacterium]|nr:helix-turn-helix transcriptional regulator [Bacillota bacterium]